MHRRPPAGSRLLSGMENRCRGSPKKNTLKWCCPTALQEKTGAGRWGHWSSFTQNIHYVIIKQFEVPHSVIAWHCENLMQKLMAVLSRWLTLAARARLELKQITSRINARESGGNICCLSAGTAAELHSWCGLSFPTQDPLSPHWLAHGVCLIQFLTGVWVCSVWMSWIKSKELHRVHWCLMFLCPADFINCI